MRLNADEIAALDATARAQGVRASTLARSYIVRGIGATHETNVHILANTDCLRSIHDGLEKARPALRASTMGA
ncbi:MAG: hypothetical protein WCP28_15000 [Actinomycetes bacterium]